MLFEEALYFELSNINRVAAIVQDRIYPVFIPQFNPDAPTKTYPALVFSKLSVDRIYDHDGAANIVETRVEIACISQDYFEAKQLADAVRLAINGRTSLPSDPIIFGGTDGVTINSIELYSEHDEFIYDEVERLSLFHIPLEFLFRHMEEV